MPKSRPRMDRAKTLQIIFRHRLYSQDSFIPQSYCFFNEWDSPYSGADCVQLYHGICKKPTLACPLLLSGPSSWTTFVSRTIFPEIVSKWRRQDETRFSPLFN